MIFPSLVFGEAINNDPVTRITQLEKETVSLSATAGEVLPKIVPVEKIALSRVRPMRYPKVGL